MDLVVLLDDSEELAEVGRDRLDERVVLVCVILLQGWGVVISIYYSGASLFRVHG